MSRTNVYYCDECGKVLSNPCAKPPVNIPHIHLVGRVFMAKYNQGKDYPHNWEDIQISNMNTPEAQYCVDCFIKAVNRTSASEAGIHE